MFDPLLSFRIVVCTLEEKTCQTAKKRGEFVCITLFLTEEKMPNFIIKPETTTPFVYRYRYFNFSIVLQILQCNCACLLTEDVNF
jgi:hypothetical protein